MKSNDYKIWFDLQKDFKLTITRNYNEAIDFFFIEEVELNDKFPVDRQWTCSTNFYVNDDNKYFHMKRLNENPDNDLGFIYSGNKISSILNSNDINKNLDISHTFDYLNL